MTKRKEKMQQKSQLIIKEQGTEICKEKTEDKNI